MVTARQAIRRGGLWALAAAVGAVLVFGCKPNLDQTVSIIEGPRVLAVRSDPAEATPRSDVTYSLLYVDPSGDLPASGVKWDYCTAREPLAELGPVNNECLQPGTASWFTPVGIGAQVVGGVPSTACQVFGPDVVQVASGPQPRPADPDSTGGYYQPVRVLSPDGAVTLGETRLACGVGGAGGEVSVTFGQRYHVNTNPAVTLSLVTEDGAAGGALMTAGEGTNVITGGGAAAISLRASWAACPLTDQCGDGVCGPDESSQTCASDCTKIVGCTGAERFVVFDLQSQSLVDQREAIGVAWYATAGSFDADSTGRQEDDDATTSDNVWHPPSSGTVHLWVVITDDRGGVGWAEYVFVVQ